MGWASSAPSAAACSSRAGSSTASSWREDTAAQYHYPPKQSESFGLHGRISNRPARLTGYGERWEGDDCTLFAEGETQVATVFGEMLVLRRRVEARVGESRLRVHDVVENVGHDLTPHMLLYHVNAGFPVVDEGSEILVAATGVAARGDHPVEGYRRLAAPAAGFVEQVFEHELGGEPDGSVPAAVVNRRLGVGLYQVFDRTQLPHHFVWRTLGEGTYVVGIEPCTNRTGGPPRRARAGRADRARRRRAAGATTWSSVRSTAPGEIDRFADRVERATG